MSKEVTWKKDIQIRNNKVKQAYARTKIADYINKDWEWAIARKRDK